MSLALQFHDQDRLRHAAIGDRDVTGQFYCLYLIAVTKFSDMGAYLTGIDLAGTN